MIDLLKNEMNEDIEEKEYPRGNAGKREGGFIAPSGI